METRQRQLLAAHRSEGVVVLGEVADYWNQLLPEEQAALDTQNVGRINQYASARHFAHLAMRKVTASRQAITRGEGGVPVWPAGLRGSLTHSGGLAAACVARVGHSVGIDIERTSRLTRRAAERVLRPEEQISIGDLTLPASRALASVFFQRQGGRLQGDIPACWTVHRFPGSAARA